MLHRRSFARLAAAAAAGATAAGGLPPGSILAAAQTPEASPDASPAASLVVDDQVAHYAELQATIRAVGEPAMQELLAGDPALWDRLSLGLADALGDASIADLVDAFVTDQLSMTYTDAGTSFFGQWAGDVFAGTMLQGAALPFTFRAVEPQEGDLPTGRWEGELTGLGLQMSLEFGIDDAGNLTATLSIPTQDVQDAPLDDVAYVAEQPVGDLVDERVFAPSAEGGSYTVDHQWGDALLRVIVGVNAISDNVASLQISPALLLPEIAAGDPVRLALPFDGTWWVFWGGETELRNYHAITPQQRYALDLVIWQDGATFSGDGTTNEDYHVWGEPVLAPAEGEIVAVVNDAPDLEPNVPPAQRNADGHPAGNHVVIETAAGAFVFIAHMQEGSVAVAVGDTVEAGDALGLTGNSGNSSEAHVHIHAQTSPDIADPEAVGVPLVFGNAAIDGTSAEDAKPVQGEFVSPTE